LLLTGPRCCTPLKARRAELEVLLAEIDEPELHPAAAQAYAHLAARLHEALEGDEGEEVRTELRKLIEAGDLHPLPQKFELRHARGPPGPWAQSRQAKTPWPRPTGFLVV
jgi:hypothetical protein